MTTIDTSSAVFKDTIMAYRSKRWIKKLACRLIRTQYDFLLHHRGLAAAYWCLMRWLVSWLRWH